ncbi:MAG: NUDIX pyrophosphatase [Bacteroidetes bacterium]|nr:NUDIX pyrophosphatase [Bacteroidota bacterium]
MNVESYLVEAHLFRKTVAGIELLLLKRSDKEIYPGIWQMVTGSIKQNEKAFETAIREIKEETGLTPSNLWVVPHINSFYSPEKNSICQVPVFVALVNSKSTVAISDEHSEYRWVNPPEAKQLLAWDGQRKSVDIIEDFIINRQSKFKFVDLTDKIIE